MKSQKKLADKIYIALIVIFNLVQAAIIFYIGLYFDCLTEIVFLTAIFLMTKHLFTLKHFQPFLCMAVTILIYITAATIIVHASYIQFLPLILGALIVLIMQKRA